MQQDIKPKLLVQDKTYLKQSNQLVQERSEYMCIQHF